MSNTVNPFAALLESNNSPSEETSPDQKTPKVTTIIEDIFGFTLNKNKKQKLVYLEDISNTFNNQDLNVDSLEHALFERVLLSNPQDCIESLPNTLIKSDICETKVILYLFTCFKKALEVHEEVLVNNIKDLIMLNVITALKQPELYENQDLIAQLYDISKQLDSSSSLFFEEIYLRVSKDEGILIYTVVHNC